MANRSNMHPIIAGLLLSAIALTGWLLMREGQGTGSSSHQEIVFNPGYQHAQRLEIATARAALDALGMSAARDNAALYRADYGRQRTQIQADSLGLESWAAHDVRHQGLLLEVRGSLASLLIALDQASGASAPLPATAAVPLLPALSRAQSALSNYSASLTEPQRLQKPPYLSSRPVRLWWLLLLLLVEVAAMACLVFFTPPHPLAP